VTPQRQVKILFIVILRLFSATIPPATRLLFHSW